MGYTVCMKLKKVINYFNRPYHSFGRHFGGLRQNGSNKNVYKYGNSVFHQFMV